jgi:hypothetical protein
VSAAPVERAREIAGESRFLQLCRVGFIGRGVLYILIGLLVLGTGRTEDLTGALEYFNEGAGRLLLMGICAGMAAYGLWRLSDAAFGVENPGSDGKALWKRGAAGFVGLIYFYLAYKALRILLSGDTGSSGAEAQADSVLDLPGGALILGLAALVLLVAGLTQLKKAVKCSFLNRLDDRAGLPVAKWMGRIGYAARGVIFILAGVLIGRAALNERSSEAGGMEEALDMLSGPVLYAVAAGLIVFGLFSILEGLFRRIHEPPVEQIKQEVRETVGR